MLLAVRISCYGCTWEVWRALKKLELLSAALRATLTLLSCSPNFPRASITRYTHAKHEPILNWNFLQKAIPIIDLRIREDWIVKLTFAVVSARLSVSFENFVLFLIQEPLNEVIHFFFYMFFESFEETRKRTFVDHAKPLHTILFFTWLVFLCFSRLIILNKSR